MARSRPCTIVIKLGTSSIVHEKTHKPLLSTLSAIVETVVHLREQGHKVVLVSSGAIGVGLQRMEMESRPKGLSGKQALAAIGQGRLIALWDNLFGQLGQPIAQILLTRGDISDRTRYLNAINTFKELLHMGVVPIVNENDTVSVSEIKFGDNDTLSAVTSSMIHADYLFLLTDVDGLYTSNPRKDPNAKAIQVVSSISAIRSQVSTSTLGSSLGTGGMETKLIAAEIATAAGVTTIISHSKHPENILSVIEYNNALRSSSATPIRSGRSSPTIGHVPIQDTDAFITESSSLSSLPLTRPLHTAFLPSPTPLRDLKSWTSHTLSPSGTVVIDKGAHHVLSRRESGGRLLPAGVVDVRGAFASGQAVKICVRRRRDGAVMEGMNEEWVDGPLGAAASSIAVRTPVEDVEASSSSETPNAIPEGDIVLIEKTETPPTNDLELEEVGRGLANYNSAQIDKVKGLNSSYISQLLGYADSEYVVENVTIRVPP